MPYIVKVASDGYLIGSSHHTAVKNLSPEEAGATQVPFLKDRENYELLLRFYDGLCLWEEGSQLPVLHITWAKHFLSCVSKFDKSMRGSIQVARESDDDDATAESDNSDAESDVNGHHKIKTSNGHSSQHNDSSNDSSHCNSDVAAKPHELDNGQHNGENNNDISKPSNGETAHRDDDTVGQQENESDNDDEVPDTDTAQSASMVDLAKACANDILNPEFLLGKGEPFSAVSSKSDRPEIPRNDSSKDHDDRVVVEATVNKSPDASSLSSKRRVSSDSCSVKSLNGHHSKVTPLSSPPTHKLRFRSAKMRGMRRLLTSERLNTSAICLQMTAQSQVSLKHSKVRSSYGSAIPRKRSRRSEPL